MKLNVVMVDLLLPGGKMAVKVKVLNADVNTTDINEISEEDKSKILTSDYIKSINEGISYRIIQQQNATRYNENMDDKIIR